MRVCNIKLSESSWNSFFKDEDNSKLRKESRNLNNIIGTKN